MQRLIFLDVETTGLDPLRDQIIEIGVLEYPTMRTFSGVVLDVDWSKCSPEVLEMHEKSGLRHAHAEYCNIETLDRAVAAWIGEYGGPMCGNSVHFDRTFLRNTRTVQRFSRRNIDVSGLRELYGFLGVEHARTRPAHRALDDLAACVEEMEFFLSARAAALKEAARATNLLRRAGVLRPGETYPLGAGGYVEAARAEKSAQRAEEILDSAE